MSEDKSEVEAVCALLKETLDKAMEIRFGKPLADLDATPEVLALVEHVFRAMGAPIKATSEDGQRIRLKEIETDTGNNS